MSVFQHTRRSLLVAAGAAACNIAAAKMSLASQVCNGMSCDSRIPTGQFPHIAQPPLSLWCWAATLAMICQWHGKQIDQTDVVRQTFGGVVNASADPMTLINAVNRSYTEQNGQQFTIQSNVWSVLHGMANVNNAGIIQELDANRPLVVCNTSHMMALVGVSYPQGTFTINQAWVSDPAFSGSVTNGIPGLPPLAPGFRYLFPAEMTPVPMGGQLTFIAAVHVT